MRVSVKLEIKYEILIKSKQFFIIINAVTQYI